ncbi:MAG: hypothetical protein JWQ87_5211 [Candidatus Sulfotelmatobacter sp.]|nr:hypothetical protein [Candidatus Sulfotelmatobacter sp.]
MVTTDTGSSLAAAAVISYLIQMMKNSRLPLFAWISQETPRVTRAVAVVLSGVATVGIHATFSNGTLIVSGLSATVILMGLWHWGVQFAYTHGWFKATSQSGELLDLVKQLLQSQSLAAKPVPTVVAKG